MTIAHDDGVIKYNSHRREGVITFTEQLAELNQARTTLFDLGLIGAYPNGVGYGNLSARTTGNRFLITASGTGADRTLRAAQYCLVESFSAESNSVCSVGGLDASSESLTHGAIYACAPAVKCVMHVHSGYLFDLLLKQNTVPSTSKDIPYGTPAMAHSVTQLVAEHQRLPVLFVMAGHEDGLVAYGRDICSVLTLLIDTFERNAHHDKDRHHRR